MSKVRVRVCTALLLVGIVQQYANASAQLIVDLRRTSFDVSVSDSGGSLNPTASDMATNPQETFVGSAISGTVSTEVVDAQASGLASQTSNYSSAGRSGSPLLFDVFHATGRAIAEASGQTNEADASGYAETHVRIFFSLGTPHAYSITGMLTEEHRSDGAFAFATSEAFASIGDSNHVMEEATGPGPVDLSGVLEPGDYKLEFKATSDVDVLEVGSANSSTSFQDMVFDLTEVPEPATGVMLLIGALVALRRGQRRRSEFSRN
ncbi:MAG: hypothetical protein DHS20C16_12490 [Phycisphaerae bacterium]|nr:MAG: hypothetical protein DHS20C16_12490 [Phycisphaerae bacterium]